MDFAEHKSLMQQSAASVLEQSLSKFADIIAAKYQKKTEEKQRKKKHKEMMQAID